MITLPSWVHSYRRQLSLAALLGILVASAVVSYQFFARSRQTSTPTASETQTQVLAATVDLGTPPEELKQLNVLLLGYGGAGHSGGFLTDVIQVAHLDFETGNVSLISIPRDLWVTLPNGTASKINAAFTLGDDPNKKAESGAQVAKQMASVVTGLPIHYAISVDFVSFKRIVGNVLDGIEVDVPEMLDDPWYPITGEEQNSCGKTPEEVAQLTAQYSGFELEKQFECRYKHVYFEPGPTKMEGEQALEFVRSRHGSGAGDFSRSARQQALLKALRDKLLTLQVASDIPTYFGELAEHVTTDITLEIAQYLAPALQKAGSYEVHDVVLSTDNVFTSGKSANGQYILMPKDGMNQWQTVHDYVATQLKTTSNGEADD